MLHPRRLSGYDRHQRERPVCPYSRQQAPHGKAVQAMDHKRGHPGYPQARSLLHQREAGTASAKPGTGSPAGDGVRC